VSYDGFVDGEMWNRDKETRRLNERMDRKVVRGGSSASAHINRALDLF